MQLDDRTREFKDKTSLLDKATKELVDARTKITALMIVQEGRPVSRGYRVGIEEGSGLWG